MHAPTALRRAFGVVGPAFVATTLLNASPGATALASTVDGARTITATRLAGPYVGAPTFSVDITGDGTDLYRFLLTITDGSAPTPQDVERWVKDHDPRTPSNGQTCVNIWNNYCFPTPDVFG